MTQQPNKPKTNRSPSTSRKKAEQEAIAPVKPVLVEELKDGDVAVDVKFNVHTLGYAFASGVMLAVLHVLFGNPNNGNGGDRL